MNVHDIGELAGKGEQPPRSAADHDGGMGLLHRPREARSVLEPVVRTGMVDPLSREKIPDERKRFHHPLDANARPVVGDPKLLVVRRQPAGSDP